MKHLLTILLLAASGPLAAQMLLNSDIVEAAQRSVDGKQYRLVSGKHVPYDNAAQFLSTITSTRRHIGQIGYIKVGTRIEPWQFINGIADSNFKAVAIPNYLRYPLIALSDSTAGLQGDSLQSYTSGSTLNVGTRVDVVVVNPASIVASLSIKLPDTASYKNEVQIIVGGTIPIGNNVITSLSFIPNTGQSILQVSFPNPITSGSSFTFKFTPSINRWTLMTFYIPPNPV
jgi:hypothetical protein